MRSFVALLSLAACCGVLHAAEVEADAARGLGTVSTYVVTFEQPGFVETVLTGPHRAYKAGRTGRTLDVTSKAAWDVRENLAADRRLLVESAARRIGRDLAPIHVYDLALNGVALKLSREEAVALAEMPGIARVEPERMLQLQT